MPHYTTWGGTYVTRPVAREDRSPIQSDGDLNDVVFHRKQADSFMKLGDIKGEFAGKHDPLTGTGGDSFNCDDILLGHGVTGFSTENLDSRLINHDDFLLVNNGGSTESVNGTIGYEMEAGTDLRSDNRFVFEPMDVMPSLGESFDPGLDGANGFKPREVSAVQIGQPPEPKLWLQILG